MCERVLKIYDKFIMKRYASLDPDTWEYIVKMLIILMVQVLEVNNHWFIRNFLVKLG